MSGTWFLISLIGVPAIYLLPWFVAIARNAKHRSWVAVLDILLGWTIIGWFVALVLASEGETNH